MPRFKSASNALRLRHRRFRALRYALWDSDLERLVAVFASPAAGSRDVPPVALQAAAVSK